MPNYFFHIAIELFTDLQAPSKQLGNRPLQSVLPIFEALRPFANSRERRLARDRSFDQRRNSPKSRVQTSPRTEQPRLEISHSDSKDHRLDTIVLEGADMSAASGGTDGSEAKENIIGKGIGGTISGQHMKGRYEPSQGLEGADGWGIVHLYRDSEETPGLYKDSAYKSSDVWSDAARNLSVGKPYPPPKDEDCTTLCILAVPSYMTPSDFLSWVGEVTRSEVSHFRMVRTSRANRYMVLMKFQNGKKAREWQHEWNGKVFNTMEPETCHVVFLKSVELVQTSSLEQNSGLSSPTTSYPRMSNDPFIPASATTKPLAPRTPSLVELPTCPVCLERMDETTGLLTIPCQHVFHCTCLEKWSGGGCPVCRYTHDDFSSRLTLSKSKSKTFHGEDDVYDGPLECEVCHADTSLWQCLLCGKVGCGRYESKHAYAHFEETGHTFSMDLESKRVWDYIGDSYVHRIIQDAAIPGEKLVELPGRRREPTALQGQDDIDMAKMDNMALEYTHLLTSQLESQRTYFEEVVERAADKASEASRRAERATEEVNSATESLQLMKTEHDHLVKVLVPDLKKDNARLEKRSAKFEEMARNMGKKYQEEQTVTKSLMERIEHQQTSQINQTQDLRNKIQQLEEDNATKALLMEGLQEEHRDAMMQVSAQQKLQQMVANGELDPEDLEGAVIEAGPAAIKKTLTTKARRKTPKQSSHNLEPSTEARASPSIAHHPSPTVNSLDKAENLHPVPVGVFDILDSTTPGKNWDEQRAKAILDQCRAKLFAEGLLTPHTTTPPAPQIDTEGEGTSDAELEGEPNGGSQPRGPARKKRGKKGGRK